MAPIIKVENLSKYYRLGLIGGGTLREDLQRWWARVRGRPDPLLPVGMEDHSNRERGEIWALRDVSFEVQQGEILGIIGRNGAGKSTLLKILSRITAPTSGRALIKGRVGSLLEVGTGFHGELTGRENTYLNGAILGMKKAEIDRKLDEIIAFAEIEKFIDTPVKRYSSGMYVRLAFAVAAHLEPEILIVDEVLAVGDAAFQKKCIGKMGEVAQGGRTVLFVSHNMPTIKALCSRVTLLSGGVVGMDADTDSVISEYLAGNRASDAVEIDFRNYNRPSRSREPAITTVWIEDNKGNKSNSFLMGSSIKICFQFQCTGSIHNPGFGFGIEDAEGRRIFSYNNYMGSGQSHFIQSVQSGVAKFMLSRLLLMPGQYYVSISLVENERYSIDFLEQAINFHVHPTDVYGTGRIPDRTQGMIYVDGEVFVD